MPPHPEPRWFKSSYSGGSGNECVECAHEPGVTLVRDSTRQAGALIAVGAAAWRAFVAGVRAGN